MTRNIFPKVLSAIVGLGLLTVAMGAWFTVDQGEIGVRLQNGAVVGAAEPGLGFKTPVIEEVQTISTRTEKQEYLTAAYSKDIQAANLKLTVNYRLNPAHAAEVYARYQSLQGAVDRIITPRVLNASKIVFGRFTANRAIAERDKLVIEMTDEIRGDMDGTGIILENVQVEDINFSRAFEDSVEQRMLAEVEVTRLRQNLEREKVQADIVREQAEAQRDRSISEAEGVAEAIRLKGAAEANAIELRGEALRKNPELVALIAAERWNGTLPATMVPGSAVPFVNLPTTN